MVLCGMAKPKREQKPLTIYTVRNIGHSGPRLYSAEVVHGFGKYRTADGLDLGCGFDYNKSVRYSAVETNAPDAWAAFVTVKAAHIARLRRELEEAEAEHRVALDQVAGFMAGEERPIVWDRERWKGAGE